MRPLRHALERTELTGLVLGGGPTVVIAATTVHTGAKVSLGVSVAVLAYVGLVAAWLISPQVMVAVTIPLFAFLPSAKVLISPVLGPVKDFITLAAAGAVLITLLQRKKRPGAPDVDRPLIWLVVAVLGLYFVNLGGTLAGGGHGIAWAQGLRLLSEPLILLCAGLSLPNPRRTLHVAVNVLVATGVVVALYGLYEQFVGPWRLVAQGYSFTHEVRKIGGHLRSFGTLDDPFAYAAFLLLAITAALFWMRRGPLKTAALSVMAIGLLFSFVRSAILISVALLAIWLLRNGRVATGFIMLFASLAAGMTFLVGVSGASEGHAVRAGPNTYITLNGRTSAWAAVFDRRARLPFGLGVGKVGTAANRANYGVFADPRKARSKTIAVDSAYFATVADVGLVGFAVVLALLARLLVLGIAATRWPGPAGWLALGWLAVLLIDAVTRESFTGFPTAFLGFLLIGLALASARPPRAATYT
jgi:hypothetical protein